MKKRVPKKVIAAAVMFAATLNMNGCVYGPPPEDDPFFSSDMNVEQNVYGPPPYYDTEETTETSETSDTAETDEFDPTININPEVYGPPSD